MANAAIVPAGTNGGITIGVSNPTDVIIDINGYYAPQPGTVAIGVYVNSNGTVQVGPPGLGVTHTGGTGTYVLNFPAGTFGAFLQGAVPVFTAINTTQVSNLLSWSESINLNASGQLTVNWSLDTSFTVVLVQ